MSDGIALPPSRLFGYKHGEMTGAVFAPIPADQGHYESFFLRAVDPEQPRAAWIRYTVHKGPGAEAVGSLWCTLFDAERQRAIAVKETRPGPQAADWITIGVATLGPGDAHGSASGQGREAAWKLETAGAEPPLRHLPREWLYRAPLPRTKLASPLPTRQTVGWVYADPSGGAHQVAHGSIAALTLRVERPGQPSLELATGHGAAYELGAREGLLGVAVEPFGDP